MAKRMDVSAPRPKKDGGTYWARVGTAWINDNGNTQIVFDALPLPDAEGRCVVNLFEPRDNSQSRQQQQGGGNWDDGGDPPF